ncbi:MAG TPA: translation initiation factor IF-2 [Deltaproteobacteria bacterium]|jgi:translation initiation factor IF-2|nr:translation initiation factor IF-2 [Deltaproteobacteria bacterium]HRW79746.1 translation initiation factor IF-2 [Desulfomonilia bacterium]HNS88433.1 translation initiation factor IF-2 [Deltaproteobacteria bacterium]HOA43337.1 translation initiation factor IF-2 [Deltaproteobacteria bacterium]HOC76685.1 translation initiation factor IF-2 [Deltaproteobacteria bacterium]
MKKMRVFELAKELSIDAKELLRIAKDLAISVESTMSVLDVHDMERIRKRLEKDTQKKDEQPAQEVYEEKRVSTNIIRRRAKAVPAPEPEEAQEKPAEEVTAETGPQEKPEEEKKKPAKRKEAAKKDKAPSAEAASEEPVQVEAVPAEPEGMRKGEEVTGEEAGAKVPAEEAPAVAGVKVKPQEIEKEEQKESKKKEKKKGKRPPKAIEILQEEEGLEEDAEVAAKKDKASIPEQEQQPQQVQPPEMEVYTQTDLYGAGRGAAGKRIKKKKDRRAIQQAQPAKKKKLKIGATITAGNLAKEMGVKVSEVIKILMNLGVMASQNQYISPEEATLVANELGFETEETRDTIHETFFAEPVYAEENLVLRPPVVTVMGHVDHGKTSLLDAIRSENIIDSEFGGITQHIGAYQAHCKDKLITFIDTPGHEAFTSMRSRGAQATDFVVLVVAADDGVMDQTREAINHAKAAKIPILVAVNKIDKPNANPMRVREQLSELGLVPEDWGGDTIYVDVSAKKHVGIEDLLEMILLQAEIMDIKAQMDGPARGVVLESKLDKNKGPMCTLLIQQGELKKGDVFVIGTKWGKARAMYDFRGAPIDRATPATPVEIIGLTEPPSAGDTMFVVPGEKKAKEIIEYLQDKEKISRLQAPEQKVQVTLEDLYSQVQDGKLKELNLIIKGDVHGTVEAIVSSVKGIDAGQDMRINVIHSAVGGITENDVLLASTSMAIIVGFNVRPEPKVRDMAKKNNIDIKLYTVIYDLIEDIKQALRGMLEPVYQEVIQGRAEVRDIFKVPKVGIIAGCMVTEGVMQRGAQARLLRDNVVIHEGKVESLRRFKDDAREVLTGFECGIGLGNYNDIKVGDIIESFTQEKVEAATTW